MPDPSIVAALQLAVLRGVDVRILLPEESDNLLTNLAAYSYFPETIPAGIQFFKYQAGLMHSKVVLMDDWLSIIGSVNVDNRSFHLNFEISAVALDEKFAAEVQEMLSADLMKSEPVPADAYSSKPFWFRLASRLAHLASPVL